MNTIIVISGIPGSGKSTVSTQLAKTLGFSLYDVDDHIPAWMKEKMKKGEPLTDEDRDVYLAQAIKNVKELQKTKSVIFTSPLFTQKHRTLIYDAFDKPLFFWLDAPYEVLEKRVSQRKHFVNPVILKKLYEHNQPFCIPHIVIDATRPVEQVITEMKRIIT